MIEKTYSCEPFQQDRNRYPLKLNLSLVKEENKNKYAYDISPYLSYEINSNIKVNLSIENQNNFIISPINKADSLGFIYTTIPNDFGDGLVRFHSSCDKMFIKSTAENVIEENDSLLRYDVELQLHCNNKVADGTYTVISSIFAKVTDDTNIESSFYKNFSLTGEFEFQGIDEILNLFSITRNFFVFNGPQFYPDCKAQYTYVVFKDDILLISKEKLESLQKFIRNNPNTADLNFINYRIPKEVDGTQVESNGELRYYGK